MAGDIASLIAKARTRLDDLGLEVEFEDSYIEGHIQNNLDVYLYDLPLENRRLEQLIILEAMIDIITGIKIWADGDSYSYKNDAIQVTRGLLSKHYLDTIIILKNERNAILEMDGGFA
jgi:hypothetical protein